MTVPSYNIDAYKKAARSKALEKAEEAKDGLSSAKRNRMKSYHANAKHNPKTGYLELGKNAPERAKKYERDLLT